MYALEILGALILVGIIIIGVLSLVKNVKYETDEEFEKRVAKEVEKRLKK